MVLGRILLGSLFLFGGTVAQSHFQPVPSTGIPYIVVITDVTVAGDSLAGGSEIAVFDDTLCVGAGLFEGEYNFQLTAWQGDESQGLSGFTPGDSMRFRVWTNTLGDFQEFEADPAYEQGNGLFGNGSYAALSLTATPLSTQVRNPSILPDTYLLNPYPNPFNAAVSIPVQTPPRRSVTVEIISLSGKQIKTWRVDRNTTLVWPGIRADGAPVSSGLYFVRVNPGIGRPFVKPITLLK